MFSIVQLSLYEDFHELVDIKRIQNTSACHFENLENNTLYYWRVKKVNEFDGNESEWSEICNFKTIVESIVIIINNDIDVIFEFDEIKILPTVCDAVDGELKKNRCFSSFDNPVNALLGVCMNEKKVLINC